LITYIGILTKKPPATADVKKRRVKYKAIDHEKKKKELEEAFARIKPLNCKIKIRLTLIY